MPATCSPSPPLLLHLRSSPFLPTPSQLRLKPGVLVEKGGKKKKKTLAVELSDRACSVGRAGFLVSSSGETFFAPPRPALERGGGGHSHISTALSRADAPHPGARRAPAWPGVHLRVPRGLSSSLLLAHTRTLSCTDTHAYTTLSQPRTTPGASTLRAAIVRWRGSSQVRYLAPAAAGSEHRRDRPEESDARTVMWIYSRFPQEAAETPAVPGSGSARRG